MSKKFLSDFHLPDEGDIIDRIAREVEYYNNRANWEGGVIGNGRLLIKEPVMVNRKLILPETVSVKIITNGKLTIPGHEFSIGGQDPSGSYDPLF